MDSGVAALIKGASPRTRSFPCALGLPQESLQKVLAQRTNARDIEHFVHISLTTHHLSQGYLE